MKITKLETFIVPPRWCFLKIETDEGIVGWGEPVVEGRAHTVAAAVEELSDYLIGKDPLLIEDHWQVMYRAGFYRGGPVLSAAVAALDEALWDVAGKARGAPAHELLGGAPAEGEVQEPGPGDLDPLDPVDGFEPAGEHPGDLGRGAPGGLGDLQRDGGGVLPHPAGPGPLDDHPPGQRPGQLPVLDGAAQGACDGTGEIGGGHGTSLGEKPGAPAKGFAM